jgi:signal transduction histidine kinase
MSTVGTPVNPAVLRTEIRLFGREPGSVFWVLCFPTLLLVILGAIPSFRDADRSLGGLRPVDAYVPVAVVLGLMMSGLQAMPQTLTGYRESGTLRRMSATPVRPSALLSAQMLVYGGAALVSALLALAVGRLAFDVRLPRQPFGYAVALILACLAALALGALISALSRTSKVAGAVGSAVLFPAMFCAGVWLPVQAMPDVLARDPSVASACYFFARWAVAFVLTWINPFFAFYAILGYFTADRLLPPRLVKPGLFATAVVMAGSNVGGMSLVRTWQTWVVFGALLGAHVSLIAVFARFAEKEQEQAAAQTAAIAELERTNTALQQALDENAALHAQLLVQAREAGVADERRRLAAEIHDTIAQGLTGIIAQLQVVANAPDLELARTHLARASDLARHSLGEARRSVHNLAPVALEHDGLPDALKNTVTQWAERTGIRADFTVTGPVELLHDEVSATLLRIAGEALSNADRHARATRAGVTLTFLGDQVILDIRDDGRGFDPLTLPDRTRTGGFGLDGMRVRAERIAGTLTVESEPGHGTALSARVPLVRHD